MKRRELIKLLEKNGWYSKRNGSNHELYTNGKNMEPIPRHPKINERLYIRLLFQKKKMVIIMCQFLILAVLRRGKVLQMQL